MTEEEDDRLFTFAGYSTLPMQKEKEELIEKIKKLGGGVDNSSSWNNRCTHVVANNFYLFNGKVLSGLASGRWVVTRRYIDKSYKNGTWSNSKPFICDQTVTLNRERFRETGGCFRNMKVLFLMDATLKRKAYTDVIMAGGGTVLEDWDIDKLLAYKPGPSELTHIVADPYIICERDHRYSRFKEWQEYAKQVWDPEKDEPLYYIYYKYFFDYLSSPSDNIVPQDYSIFSPRVLQAARRNGDFKMPDRNATNSDREMKVGNAQTSTKQTAANTFQTKPIQTKTTSPLPDPAKRQAEDSRGANKKRRTEIVTNVVETNVVDLSDSDDDDIQILEQKLREEVGSRRTYLSVRPQQNKKEITLDSSIDLCSESERDESRGPSDDEESNERNQENLETTSKFSDDSDIEVIETKEARPPPKKTSQKSKLFMKKLAEIEAKEEKKKKKREKEAERRAGRISLDSRGSNSPEPAQERIPIIPTIIPTVEIPPPTSAMQRLSLEDKQSDEAKLFNRILASILERQAATDECIEIAHATPRTARYDKNKEFAFRRKMKLVPVGELVKEEFYNRYIEKKDTSPVHQQMDSDDDSADEIQFQAEDGTNNHVALLEILEYLKSYTNMNTYPTSSILHVLMRDFIMNQTCSLVAKRSYQYIDQFLFRHLGGEGTNREDWLNLMLSALRDNQNFNQFEEFSLESSQDLQSCWRFFSLVLENSARNAGQSDVMLRILVKICQRDFELWWKHHRRTEHKDNRELSYPILFYLVEGRRNFIENVSRSILKLYKMKLTNEDEDISDVRKLVKMGAMLAAHLDWQDKNGLLSRSKGLKFKYAAKLEMIFAKSNLNSDDLYIEMNLVKPAWLSLLVSKKYLLKEKEKDLKGLKDVLNQVEDLSSSCDTDMFACLDTMLAKTFATMHLHTIIRTSWHIQSSEKQERGSVFAGTSKLEKNPHRSPNVWKLKSDVALMKSQVVEDANEIIAYHNQEKSLSTKTGVLKSAFFKMSSSLDF